MTILYFLVDTEEGGGTVFPLADTTEEQYNAWANSNHYLKYKQVWEEADVEENENGEGGGTK